MCRLDAVTACPACIFFILRAQSFLIIMLGSQICQFKLNTDSGATKDGKHATFIIVVF